MNRHDNRSVDDNRTYPLIHLEGGRQPVVLRVGDLAGIEGTTEVSRVFRYLSEYASRESA